MNGKNKPIGSKGFNKHTVGAMIKIILKPFGYEPIKQKRLSKDLSKYFSSASVHALNLNKKNVKLSKNLYLEHHDISQEDNRVTEIRIKREELWTKLIAKFRINSECWNLYEIESAIQSLQEYFSIDYPEELNLSVKQYCRAIDNLSRVSLNCLSILQSNKPIDIGELSYISKKLMEIFLELGIAK